ncbi:hypothetical protein LXL04_008585 [Taraxacum kok-saghyz]
MRLWSDDNILAITKSFGKILNPSDELESGVNKSLLKIGILTKSRKWINDEVDVVIWSPFPILVDSDSDGGDTSEEEDDAAAEEGVSDTDMWLEDGEIPADGEDSIGDGGFPSSAETKGTGNGSSCYVSETVGIPKTSEHVNTFNNTNDEAPTQDTHAALEITTQFRLTWSKPHPMTRIQISQMGLLGQWDLPSLFPSLGLSPAPD